MPLPISAADVAAARERLRPHLEPTPVRDYPQLDAMVGHGIRVLVKHENHLPVGTFKVRNAVAAVTALDAEARSRGIIAATTGNHGLGLAWAGRRLGVPVTICVPVGNNPEKNATIRALGARLVEVGATYDDCAAACAELAAREGLAVVHSTNHREVLAGAGTLTAEFLEQAPALDALVMALGGGSQCVGAIAVRDAVRPALEVVAAQSALAPAQHDGWRDGQPRRGVPARTFAEGVATGSTYDLTFEALRAGLADFVLVTDDEIAEAVRDLLRITHNLAEGAGAVGLAAVKRHAGRFAGRTVGIVVCGGNMDSARLGELLRAN